MHMLFHILGRYHEHERADREKYIDIIDENIMEGKYINAGIIITSIILSVYRSLENFRIKKYSCVKCSS